MPRQPPRALASVFTTHDALRVPLFVTTTIGLALGVTVPLLVYFSVWEKDKSRFFWVLVVNIAAQTLIALACAWSCFTRRSFLASMAAAFALTFAVVGGSCTATFNLLYGVLVSRQCQMSQSSFLGCAACACALNSTCTTKQLCDGCEAYGTDICDAYLGRAWSTYDRMLVASLPAASLLAALVQAFLAALVAMHAPFGKASAEADMRAQRQRSAAAAQARAQARTHNPEARPEMIRIHPEPVQQQQLRYYRGGAAAAAPAAVMEQQMSSKPSVQRAQTFAAPQRELPNGSLQRTATYHPGSLAATSATFMAAAAAASTSAAPAPAPAQAPAIYEEGPGAPAPAAALATFAAYTALPAEAAAPVDAPPGLSRAFTMPVTVTSEASALPLEYARAQTMAAEMPAGGEALTTVVVPGDEALATQPPQQQHHVRIAEEPVKPTAAVVLNGVDAGLIIAGGVGLDMAAATRK